jgi:hypothetical protein
MIERDTGFYDAGNFKFPFLMKPGIMKKPDVAANAVISIINKRTHYVRSKVKNCGRVNA